MDRNNCLKEGCSNRAKTGFYTCEAHTDKTDELLASRQKTHGDPLANLSHIADLWSAFLRVPVRPWQVAIMNQLQKFSRMQQADYNPDDFDDNEGYARIAKQLAAFEQRDLFEGHTPECGIRGNGVFEGYCDCPGTEPIQATNICPTCNGVRMDTRPGGINVVNPGQTWCRCPKGL